MPEHIAGDVVVGTLASLEAPKPMAIEEVLNDPANLNRGPVIPDLEMEDWYVKAGIPHRRGYLLHGPPGTGKSA